jgi:uroporphyrinogen-III synthase
VSGSPISRVAVTAPVDRAALLADELSARGLTPVLLPCVDVVPADPAQLKIARQEAACADLLLLTSARVLEVLWAGLAPPSVPVVAVGEATAAAARGRGLPVLYAGSGNAASLLAPTLPFDVAGWRVAWPHAAGADRLPAHVVDGMGATVTARTVYCTVPVAPGGEAVEVATFTSPSAVEGWVSGRSLDGLLIGAIGATTAAALLAAGSKPDVVPLRPSYRLLAAAVADAIDAAHYPSDELRGVR